MASPFQQPFCMEYGSGAEGMEKQIIRIILYNNLICSQAVYDNYSKDDYFLDLSTLFDEATCEKYGIKAGDTCLDISKLKKYQDMGLTYYEPCYLTVVVNTKNADNVAKLIEYLEEDGVNE